MQKRRFSNLFGVIKNRRFFGGKKPEIPPSLEHELKRLTEEEVILEREYRGEENKKLREEIRKEKESKELEIKMFLIQKSTRTTFSRFLRMHNNLRSKYRWYYNWHLLPYSGKVHWATLFSSTSVWLIVILISILGLHTAPLTVAKEAKPELVVTEQNAEKTPCKFFFKSDSGKCDQPWQKISDDDKGLRIRTKSATTAGYQDILMKGNEMSLFDGTKLVATGTLVPQELVNGKWQEISEKSEIRNPNIETNSNSPNSNPKISPYPTSLISPFTSPSTGVILNGSEGSPAPAGSGPKAGDSSPAQNDIVKAEKNHLSAKSSKTLANGKNLDIAFDVKTEGKGKDQKISQKQTYSLPANPNGNKQRIVLNVDLKDYDIKADSSQTATDGKIAVPSARDDESLRGAEATKQSVFNYNNTILDLSDYKGATKIEEKASSDQVSVIFEELGTNSQLLIDPIFSVTTPAGQISVDDGTRKWVFDETMPGAPKYFYHTSVGSGAENIASTATNKPFIGPGVTLSGTLSSCTQTLVENTPTRVKIRTQGGFTETPTAVDSTYTIYPDGHAFLTYSDTVNSSKYGLMVQHYLNATPQVFNHDNTNHAFVYSDTSNNNYPGMAVVPYTSSEFGDAAGWATYTYQPDDNSYIYKTFPDATYSGNMVIDFSNYRATTTTRDNLRDDYRTPATLANFDKGSQSGDGYNEGEGAYTIAADGSGDAKFDFQKGTPTRYKPAFKITGATRSEDSYQIKVAGVRKTKGVDYNLSKIDASTVVIQWLSDVAANLTDFELTGIAGMVSKAGSYVGDGTDNRVINGFGFQPDLVFIKSQTTTQGAVFKTSDMVGDASSEIANINTLFANGIQSLDADGMTIGTDLKVNETGITYHWQAFKDNGAADFTTGTYAGDGNDNRNVVTGLPFQPALVAVKRDGASYGVWKSSSLIGDQSLTFATGDGTPLANYVQALNSDGFQIGNDSCINANGQNYYWFAFAEIPGWLKVGSYTGDGNDNRSITGIGFQPNWVWLDQETPSSFTILHKPSTLAGDAALRFNENSTPLANYIQALETDGFQVGSSANSSPRLHHYIAFKFTTQTGGQTGNKVWDGGGGADTNWSTALNWSDDAVPQPGDNVVFGATSTNNSTIDAGFAGSIGSLTIGTGYSGTITANRSLTVNNDFSLEQGTYNANGQALNIGGSFSRVGGTFTHNNNTTTFNATSTGKTILSGGQAFYNLTFDGLGGGWTMTGNSSIANDFNLTNGTLSMGGYTMTCSGNYTIAGAATFNKDTSSIVLNGDAKIIDTNNKKINSLRFSGNYTVQNSNTYVENGGILTVDADKTLTIAASRELTKMYGTIVLNGTINGDGRLSLVWGADAMPATGVVDVDVWVHVGVEGTSIPARTYNKDLTIYTNLDHTCNLGTAGGQTITINGNLLIWADGGGKYNKVYASNRNPNVNIGGDLLFNNSGGGGAYLYMGSGNWTVSGNVDARSGTITAGASTLKLNSTVAGKNVYSNSQGWNNVSFEGVNGGWTLQDNLTAASLSITDGTLTDNGKQVTVNGNISFPNVSKVSSTGIWILGANGNISNTGAWGTNIIYDFRIADGVVATKTSNAFTVRKLTLGVNSQLVGNFYFVVYNMWSDDFIDMGAGSTISGSDLYIYTNSSTTRNQKAFTTSCSIYLGYYQSANVVMTGGWTVGGMTVFGSTTSVSEATAAVLDTNGKNLTVNGNLVVGKNATNQYYGKIKYGSGIHSITGDLKTGDAASYGYHDLGTANISVAGNVDFRYSTVTTGSGTLHMTATSAGKNFYSNAQTLPNLSFEGAGGGWTLQDANNTNGNLTVSAGTLYLGSVTTTVAGDFSSVGGTLSRDTSKLIMTGNGKSLIIDDDSLYDVQISGNITCTRINTPIYHSLVVDAGQTFTIGSSVRMQDGSTVTIADTGTITGAGGTLWLSGTACNVSTTGTISTRSLYFTGTSCTVPARTYQVTFGTYFWGPVLADQNFTLGTAPGQTLTFQSDFNLYEVNAGHVNVRADTFNPTINIGGNLAVTGSGLHNLYMGNGTWTVGGNVDFTNGTVTRGTSTLKMNGAGKTLTGNVQGLNNLQISENISAITSQTNIYGTLTVDEGKTFTPNCNFYLRSGSTTTINGTITSNPSGTYMYYEDDAGSRISTSGTFSAGVQFYNNNSDVIVTARDYNRNVRIINVSNTPHITTLGTAGSQTFNFGGNLSVLTNANGNVDLKADTWNPTINITGDLTMSKVTGTPSITMGSGTWTVGGNVDFTNGTVTAGTSTLVMNGAGKTLTAALQTLNNLQIADNITVQTNHLYINGTLTVNDTKILTITTVNLIMKAGSTTTLLGTITGSGFLELRDSAGANLGTGGTLSCTTIFTALNSNVTIPARTYSGWEVRISSISQNDYSAIFGTAPGQTISAQRIRVFAYDDGRITADASVYNPNITTSDYVLLYKGHTGIPAYKMGAGTWTVDGIVDFSDGEVDAGTSTLKLTGFNDNLTTNGQALHNFEASSLETLNDDLTLTGYLKINAGGSLNVTNRTLNIAGDLDRVAGSTFTTTGSTVNLNGAANSLVHGSTAFNNLNINSTSSAAGRSVTFDGLSTQTAASLGLTGAAGKILTLQSSDGNNWTINPTAVTSSTYLDVFRSTNTGVAFCADNSTNSGNNIGWQISTGPTCTPPTPPSGFGGQASSTTAITWNWTDNADNENGYRVHDNGHASVSGNLPINTATYPEAGLNPNTQYTRHVNVFNDFGNEDSNIVSKYTLASDPGWLSASASSSSSINLSWASGGAENSFNLYRNGPSGSGQLIYSGHNLSFSDTSLSPSTTYVYYLYAVNGENVETANYSTASAQTPAAAIVPAPAPSTTSSPVPSIPSTVVVNQPVTMHWYAPMIDLSWLHLPTIHIPAIHFPEISITLPRIHIPRLSINWPDITLPEVHLPKIPSLVIVIPDIQLPHLPRISFHLPHFNLPKISWDFGDGYQQVKNRVSHTYSRVGQYFVKLKVTGDGGKTQEVTREVTVIPDAPVVTSIKPQGNHLLIEGIAYPESTVYLTISSTPITVKTEADKNGKFRYLYENPEQTLVQGEHEVKAYASIKVAQAEIKGIESKDYNFFIDYQGQMKVVESQKKIWQYIAITAICVALVLFVLLGLQMRRRRARA